MKIIGVISDTHIPSRGNVLPEKVVNMLLGHNVDLIVHCGDFESLQVLESLKNIAPVVAVRGNMDSIEIRKKLNDKEIISVEDMKIGITHGSGGKNGYYDRVIEIFQDDNIDMIFSGHTHHPEAVIKRGITIINPGSPTDKRFAPRNTIAIVKIEKGNSNYDFIEF